MNESAIISKAMAILGSRKSAAKKRASKRNGSAPCRNGRRRGWPKGKPRKSKGERTVKE